MRHRATSDDQFGGIFKFQPQEHVIMAVDRTEGETEGGLPKFMVGDASDAGYTCGPACSSDLAAQDNLRQLDDFSGIRPEQMSSPGDRRLVEGRTQYDIPDLMSDQIWNDTGGQAKTYFSSGPVMRPEMSDVRYGAGDIADLAQTSCSGPNCSNPVVPGGTGDPWSKRKPWAN